MFLRPLCAILAAAVVASSASAQVRAFPGPAGPRPLVPPGPVVPREIGPDHAPSCMLIYANETTDTGFYVPVGASVELADDLHTTSQGVQALCAFDFGYFKPTPGEVNAVVTFYDGDPGDGPPGAVLAGPISLQGLPTGLNAFHVEVPGGLVDEDIWMGVSFSDAGTGLLTFGPPSEGESHDLAWENPPGELGSFGGQPPANFFLAVYSSPSTAALPATWGSLKAIYR